MSWSLSLSGECTSWNCPVNEVKIKSSVFIRIFTGRMLDSQGCKVTSTDKEVTDQTPRMRRQIWLFVVRTCQKVRFLTLRLIWMCWRNKEKNCWIKTKKKKKKSSVFSSRVRKFTSCSNPWSFTMSTSTCPSDWLSMVPFCWVWPNNVSQVELPSMWTEGSFLCWVLMCSNWFRRSWKSSHEPLGSRYQLAM